MGYSDARFFLDTTDNGAAMVVNGAPVNDPDGNPSPRVELLYGTNFNATDSKLHSMNFTAAVMNYMPVASTNGNWTSIAQVSSVILSVRYVEGLPLVSCCCQRMYFRGRINSRLFYAFVISPLVHPLLSESISVIFWLQIFRNGGTCGKSSGIMVRAIWAGASNPTQATIAALSKTGVAGIPSPNNWLTIGSYTLGQKLSLSIMIQANTIQFIYNGKPTVVYPLYPCDTFAWKVGNYYYQTALSTASASATVKLYSLSVL